MPWIKENKVASAIIVVLVALLVMNYLGKVSQEKEADAFLDSIEDGTGISGSLQEDATDPLAALRARYEAEGITDITFDEAIRLYGENTIRELLEAPIVERSAGYSDPKKISGLYQQMLPTLPAHDLYCIADKKFSCGLEGCEAVEPTVFTLVGQMEGGLFLARCDDKPCDIYPVNLVQSGSLTTIKTIESHGMLFRTSNVDQSFIEVVTLGTDALVSSGYCYRNSN